jgi:hypothetical protein
MRSVSFNRAIYALGSRTNAESVPGVAEYAYRLDPGDRRESARSRDSRDHDRHRRKADLCRLQRFQPGHASFAYAIRPGRDNRIVTSPSERNVAANFRNSDDGTIRGDATGVKSTNMLRTRRVQNAF